MTPWAFRHHRGTALLSGEISPGAGLLGGGGPYSMPKGYNPNSLSGLY
jgi:hypothetical protein